MVKVPMRKFVEVQPSLQGKGLVNVIRDGKLRGRIEKSSAMVKLSLVALLELVKRSRNLAKRKGLGLSLGRILWISSFLQIQGSGRLAPFGKI